MRTVTDCLLEFHHALAKKAILAGQNEAFDLSRPGQDFIRGGDTATLRKALINEEKNEVDEAIDLESLDHLLKECADLVYVVVGTCVSFGLDFDVAFNRVHENNMLKVARGEFNKAGKLVKPADHPSVDLTDCVPHD
jgi:predicted HAD superfamily Cof-like phosphohydrolase